MYNQQALPSIQSYLCAFDNLLCSNSHTPQSEQAIPRIPKFRGQVQIYSDEQARSVLCKLFERSQTNAQKKNWKVEQTNLLCFIVEKYQTAHGIKNEPIGQQDWQKVSQCVPNRDASACRFRYLSLTSPNISQQPWCQSESQMLFRLVQPLQQESINWKQISQKLYDCGVQKIFRTGKQCREHYTCFLRPNLKKGQWTSDQDYIMVCLFLKEGKKWSKMTKFIQGRNENSIKNRFFLIFQNKVKAKLSHSDLVKLAKRKKEKLQRAIKNRVTSSSHQENQLAVELPTEEAPRESEQVQEEQESQLPNAQIIFSAPEKQQTQLQKDRAEQKCEQDFTQDFEKYIDF